MTHRAKPGYHEMDRQTELPEGILLFKTNIGNQGNAHSLRAVFEAHERIKQWYVDLEDRDRVLKVVAEGYLEEKEVIAIVKERGFACEVLSE